MKLDVLICYLQQIQEKHGDIEVEVMAETANMQIQMPCNDVAYDTERNVCIVLGEGEDDV